jgi:hypothetical protein
MGVAFGISLIALFPATHFAPIDDPWADEVIEYSAADAVSGYTDASVALGAPFGIGPSTPANSGNVVSLGTPSGSPRGRLVLKFNTPVTDDPQNPQGLDFIIFSNAFWVGGDPQKRFEEPALVEISDDGSTWYLIPGSRSLMKESGDLPLISEADGDNNLGTGEELFLAGNITNPNLLLDVDTGNDNDEHNWGYAELSPTLAPYLDNYVRPDDPLVVGIDGGSGGGDAFDIAWAITDAGAPANLTQFQYLRISPFVERNMGGLGLASPEIGAAADVAPDVDSDGDGILDEFETRVALTDPARPESTILPLVIPGFEGGSPNGASLGAAADGNGNRIELFSVGTRTLSTHTVAVDLLPETPPVGTVPTAGFSLSGSGLDVQSSEPSFTAAEIDSALITFAYHPSDVNGLDETELEPFRYDGANYTQTGITSISVDTSANTVSFRSTVAGEFALAGPAGSGDGGSDPVWVNFAHTGLQQGTLSEPYATTADGVAGVMIGGTVHFAAGDSAETLTLDRPATLDSTGGAVRIGVAARQAVRIVKEDAKTGFVSRSTTR